jgi:hypothetical protein
LARGLRIAGKAIVKKQRRTKDILCDDSLRTTQDVPSYSSHRITQGEESNREVTEDSRDIAEGIYKIKEGTYKVNKVKGRTAKEKAITATLGESDRH